MAAWFQHPFSLQSVLSMPTSHAAYVRKSASLCRKRGAPILVDQQADLMASSIASNTSAAASQAAVAAHRTAPVTDRIGMALPGLPPADQELLRRQDLTSWRRAMPRHRDDSLRHPRYQGGRHARPHRLSCPQRAKPETVWGMPSCSRTAWTTLRVAHIPPDRRRARFARCLSFIN